MSHVFLLFSICPSFYSRGTHVRVFWNFPISHGRLKTVCWLTSNCSASCFWVCESSSSNMFAIPHLQIFCGFPCFSSSFFFALCRSYHFWNAETIIYTYHAMEHVHLKLLEAICFIRQQFSSNEKKKLILSTNALCSVNFLHNTTLCTHFSNLSPFRIWHLFMPQQNGAVSNICSSNCSDVPCVVWNLRFILVRLVIKDCSMTENVPIECSFTC